MKGLYKDPSGNLYNVTDFDEVNKIACVEVPGGNEWYHEADYLTWVKQDDNEASADADTPEDEKPKKRTVKKKKDETDTE